ncbi:conserved hypothetical protein [Talaromyces stipitatus ATCC 10500]|uniref:NAD(P)-binding domain-containing protein n=1 Tax=Talaromyces stipitatus (strain ATCC 10500 / CBS 375.48 / QM 6759 / NRRL 1006) TaxID=441959 RepID=B8LYR0_TALSN|nr:uncharacterized protein TSTA_068430 [Talaromyces stipitatus ATCC 10500]EED23419.1 conserved hypothetical protein [Talaromyces stipitatus ATCC 10500]
MANNAIGVALLGSTGLGSHILTNLLTHSSVARVDTISRRTPSAAESSPNVKLTTVIETDTSSWPSKISQLSPPPTIFFSALGTTRSQAGGLENQSKLELDTNIECAKAARDAGAKVYVLISSNGANSASMVPYLKLKGQIEEAAKQLGFEHTVFVRPGIIVGERGESRPAEAVMRFLATSVGKIHSSLKDGWAQDADAISKASLAAGLKSLAGEAPAESEKVWIVDQAEIIRLAREE